MTDDLYSISDIVAATGGVARNLAPDARIASISIDSRELGPRALFVAIRGDRFDGHDFVRQAMADGAAAAMIGAAQADALADLPTIVVPDALEGLNALARLSRARSKARIVAVTGSVGKTSTKEAIRAVLATGGRTHAAIKSFNNHWGVPLMLARMPRDAQFGVFEIGMNHAGEITPLARLVAPHVAVITNVGEAHLEFFDSVRGIADAKAEIFAGLEPGGTAILGADHDQIDHLLLRAAEAGVETITTYGFGPAVKVRISAQADGRARVEGAALDMELAVGVPGRHALANATAALLAGRACGIDPARAAEALATLGAAEGRGVIHALGPAERPLVLIDESYNANPASMRAALEVYAVSGAANERRVLVLGDMLELGAKAALRHAELAPVVLAARPDRVVLVGPHMGALAPLLPPEMMALAGNTVEDIAAPLLDSLAYGDRVMVKGSNGVRMGTLIGQIRQRFGH